MSKQLNQRGDFATDHRILVLILAAIPTGVACAFIALLLVNLINVFTNLFFFHELSLAAKSPALAQPGVLTFLCPALGGLIIGLMARFGSERIRGHGIPEALEAILYGKSIMKPKIAVLKPLSSAISIGSGGPFGAEGPIIMTGGAIGSILTQFFRFSSAERKTLLVSGAAAGMAAVFASPIAAVLLAVELLLFEWKPRSVIPVAISATIAAALRPFLLGSGPVFPLMTAPSFTVTTLLCSVLVGLIAGASAILLSGTLYKIEDAFQRLPIHWMWWPIMGGLAVGIGALFEPRVLGIGNDVIADLLNGQLTGGTAGQLILIKAIVWMIALGSGTSGGVLAPLMMMGAGLGVLEAQFLPGDVSAWALISLSAMLAGMMRSPFTAIIFALELTHCVDSLPSLLIASIAAYALTVLVMKRSILTEKIARRGFDIFREYHVDPLERVTVDQVISKLDALDISDDFNKKLAIAQDATCRSAAEQMAKFDTSHLFVMDIEKHQPIGTVKITDLLKARSISMEEEEIRERVLF